MIWLSLLVWICSCALSWILAPVGSLRIYILSTLDVSLVAVLGIPDSYFSLLVVFLGSSPWHSVASRRFCNPSSGVYQRSTISNSDLDQGARVVALGLPPVPAPCLLGLVANNCGVTASPPLRADKSTNL
jgi:hypothetical protein